MIFRTNKRAHVHARFFKLLLRAALFFPHFPHKLVNIYKKCWKLNYVNFLRFSNCASSTFFGQTVV